MSEHSEPVHNELMKNIKLSGLWAEWFSFSGDPYIADSSDTGRPDYCFFCREDKPGHAKDCVYRRAKELVRVEEGE